ncbi:glycosyltransferase [Parabacteroides sp. TM07-1AC]|uniref:glycosyltransferase family 2 protein n=1 Tax=Parabacteroides sp. TM07-1AC TaxID=2292363 RepID=UPI000EFFD26B|nr:glycosyltransferase [Parabacteroides sp. TM07-1AC]RHU30296.1 glycosyltransferase [Parabacteroides sp. TM07-1AC]
MEEKPLISIITITRNRASLIHKCIRSIQKQTYTNYEHIIVDGNSSDNTSEVVAAYTKKDSKIKYIYLNYCGAEQLHQGFLASKGQYITFLDDDDEYLPHNLEKKLELLSSLDSTFGFIYGPMDYFNASSGEFLYTHKATYEGGKEILPFAVADSVVCGTPSMMFRRCAFESIGGSYIDGIGNNFSDWALATKALAMGWKVKRYDQSLVKIYQHPLARLSDNTIKGVEGAKKMLLFHSYFLSVYDDVIKVNPKSAAIHYRGLVGANLRLRNFKEACKNYIRLLKVSKTLKNLVYPLHILIIMYKE